MSSSNCCFLTCIQISQEADQVVWYSHLLKNFPQFIVIHTVKGFGIVNKAEIDVFMELCFFDPVDVDNLISGSYAFSKTSLNIRKFTVHVLLKPALENFESITLLACDECNCAVVWAFFGIGMKADLFQSCGHCWVFQICWHIECSTFTASSFRIWNSSTTSTRDTQIQVCLSLCGISGSWCTQGLFEPSEHLNMGFNSKCNFAPFTIFLGLFAPGHGVSPQICSSTAGG